MRRATLGIAVLLALTATASTVHAQLINGIGLIDYTRKPTFKIGDWVRYRVQGSNDRGEIATYETTVLIAGEQRFWGEDCFWVETWTHREDGQASQALATLMSYSIFGDSAAIPRMKLYMRKAIQEYDRDGNPIEEVTKRPPLTLKNRRPPSQHTAWDTDTLGVDTVSVPKGEFRCTKIQMREGVAVTAEKPDSTMRTEVMETRTLFMSDRIPVTRLARESIEQTTKRKVWAVGRSQDATDFLTTGRSQGEARIVDFGSGLTPLVVPERYRRPIAVQEAPRKPAASRAG
jgi:hypothetical protein